MQVSPSSSKLPVHIRALRQRAVTTPIGLWQLSQCRVNSMPLVRARMFTLVR